MYSSQNHSLKQPVLGWYVMEVGILLHYSVTEIVGDAVALVVSALDSGSKGPGSSPGRGHWVVFLGKTLYSHGASNQKYELVPVTKC